MKYGIIGYGTGRKCYFKRHFGLIYYNGDGNIKLTLLNKSHSAIIKGRNKKLFNKILKLLNKSYDLEDLNKKNNSSLKLKRYKRIKRDKR